VGKGEVKKDPSAKIQAPEKIQAPKGNLFEMQNVSLLRGAPIVSLLQQAPIT